MRKGKANSPGDGLMTTNKYAAYLGKTPVDPEGLKGRRRLTQRSTIKKNRAIHQEADRDNTPDRLWLRFYLTAVAGNHLRG